MNIEKEKKIQTINIMIDIETGGLVPGSSIFSIGACYFALSAKGPYLPESLAHSFYSVIDRASCKEVGLAEYAETMEWWGKQAEEARMSTLYGRVPVKTALTDLATYITEAREAGYKVLLWCKQNNFDFSLLEAAYKACDIDLPWTFRELRDCRTVFEMFSCYFAAGTEDALTKGITKHNALDDAVHQARKMEHLLKWLAYDEVFESIYLLLLSDEDEEEGDLYEK